FLSIYQAGRHFDGLIVEDYYPKAERYFKDIKRENRLGLRIDSSNLFNIGRNKYVINLQTSSGKLKGAEIYLTVRKVSERSGSRFILSEVRAGYYETIFNIPQRGYYLFVLTIKHPEISTERRWFQMVE
ncbi:MAG: hypothetical protein GXO97_00845, partial [Nitrospirae bacterium]|nr:hypothetical protein [Nitrospirota bacterium]